MGSDADPIFIAGLTPIHIARPSCAVRGLLEKATHTPFYAICAHAGIGGRSCLYQGECEHKRAPQEAKQGEQANG